MDVNCELNQSSLFCRHHLSPLHSRDGKHAQIGHQGVYSNRFWLKMATPSSAKMVSESREDSLEVLLARLKDSPTSSDKDQREVAVGRNGDGGGAGTRNSRTDRARRQFCSEDHGTWKTLFDQISREIYDELDAQMMAEMEKMREEQSRYLDEELDRQLQEQLDTMLEANLLSEHGENDNDSLEDYSSDDDDEEGGEGGIPSLGFDFEHDDTCNNFCAPKYSEEELQAMVDTLYGEEGAKLSAPGGWGRGKWRPRRDMGDVSP